MSSQSDGIGKKGHAQGPEQGADPFSSEGRDACANFPGFSPSPSPALSAYSYSSGSSVSDLDPDIAELSLDDWGFTRGVAAKTSATDKAGNASGKVFSGTATPIGPNQGTPIKGKYRSPVQMGTKDAGEHPAESGARGQGNDETIFEEEGDGFDLIDEDEEDMHASGIPAARGWKLDARHYDTTGFRQRVVDMFSNALQLSGWSEVDVHPSLWPLSEANLHLKRISGALTNAVFFASYRPKELPGKSDGRDVPLPPTLLLRVYGVGSEVLLSRRGELLILHTLSSLYEIGPHILGTFANGRVEEHFKCEPIGKDGLRDLGTREEFINKQGHLHVRGVEGSAQWVARRMRELHEVPLDVMRRVLEQGDLHAPSEKGFGRGMQNHIMASSHRPRKGSLRPSRGYTPIADAGSRILRESPAPVTPDANQLGTSLTKIAQDAVQEQQQSSEVQSSYDLTMKKFSPQRNGSVASFDSLATSFDSRASFSSVTSDRSLRSPSLSASYTGNDTYFPPGARAPQSPNTSQGRSSSRSNSGLPRRPYPGVWRRLKRWSREAAKVLQLFNDFANSPRGREVCAEALKSAPSDIDIGNPSTITSDKLSATSGDLCNTLLCMIAFDFPRLMRELDAYKSYIREWEKREGQSKRVFAHNDSQYGNLLRVTQPSGVDQAAPVASGMRRTQELTKLKADSASNESAAAPRPATKRSSSQTRAKRMAPHQQIVVIDFEYASPNPRAYDIANHFHEWRTDYHHPTLSWSLTHHGTYPDAQQRRKWLRSYVEQGRLLRMRGTIMNASLEMPTEFSLGPPAFPVAKPEVTSPAPQASDSTRSASLPFQRISQTEAGAASPSLTPFLRGQLSPRSPFATPQSPAVSAQPNSLIRLNASIEREVERLEREVNMWSPAAHAVWGLWGIVFGRAEIELLIEKALSSSTDKPPTGTPEDQKKAEALAQEAGAEAAFDYLRYALGRMELFRYESKDLGVI